MRNQITYIIILLLLFYSCKEGEKVNSSSKEVFSSEISHLQEYFQIPGISILIKKGDTAIYED